MIKNAKLLPPLWGKVGMGVELHAPPTFLLPRKGGGEFGVGKC